MVKNNYKLFIGIIIGALISGTSVYAATTIIKSKDVSYDKSSSGGKYDNVQDAIDELYEKSGLLKDNWVDKTLNGADPVLDVEGATKKLIPITLDNDGTVHYANLKTKWYDYADKKWANAVLLVDNPKNGGEENYNYKVGDIILEEDIESYFVWIPRYSYKIWDMADTEEYNSAPNITDLNNTSYATSPENAFNRPKIIDIKFGNSSTNPKMEESQAKLNEYYTHPAFTLGDKDLNGIWVGKFEIGYNQNGNNGNPISDTSTWSTANAGIKEENSKRIIVKPNVYIWNNNTVQNYFLSSYKYNRSLESHMMKNTEWGAVAYLSHSAYGLSGKININNNSYYVTGYGATAGTNQDTFPGTSKEVIPGKSDEITCAYNTKFGYLASTTGNIYGVYDMRGGTSEYMASYVSGDVGKSGFSNDADLITTYKKYFDVYSIDSNETSYNKRILGDATGEMGPFYTYYDANNQRHHSAWYTNGAYFITSNVSWFARGGASGDGGLAGQFYFWDYNGDAVPYAGSRLVLSF